MDSPTDRLAAVKQAAFAALAEGAAAPASPWRTLALATSMQNGPGLRMVVARRFVPETREVEFHTDARAPKMAALRCQPLACLLAWDPASRVQIRLQGAVSALDQQTTDGVWRDLGRHTRATYAGRLAPGTPIPAPEVAVSDSNDAAARAVFVALRMSFVELEWLHLAAELHQRARFIWANGVAEATWLAP